VQIITCLLGFTAASAVVAQAPSLSPVLKETAKPKRPWTILVYGAVDNSADEGLIALLDKMRRAIDDDPGVELLLFIDRSRKPGKRTTYLGDDFTTTRLYRLRKTSAERLSGDAQLPQLAADKEAKLNSADAANVGRFIAWGKAHYPAQRYALMIYSHADGKSMCPVTPTGDHMGIAELTDKVGVEQRVDFLALELCFMGGIEIAYQWRPGNGRFESDVLLAVPNAGPSLDWDRVFARIRSPGHAAKSGPTLDPAAMTAADFGRLTIEECYRGRQTMKYAARESAGCYDLRKAGEVKKAIDALSVELARADAKDLVLELRGSSPRSAAISYADDDGTVDYNVDLYDLCRRLAGCDRLGGKVRAAAKQGMVAVERFMIASYGMSAYKGFEPGKNGVYIVLPSGKPGCWKQFRWYTPLAGTGKAYGRWSFLRDGATPGNGVVENWFELLESWFDAPDEKGGTGARNGADDGKLDKKVLDIVKQVSNLHKNARSLHVEAALSWSGGQGKFDTEVTYDLEQPNRLAMRSRHQHDKDAGLTVVCDGKVLFTYAAKAKHYAQTAAPTDWQEMGAALLRLGRPNTGMLFANVLAADPYEQLMDGVKSCSYAGKDKVGEVEAHHLKFSQDQFDWEMWVAVEGKPLVVKMTRTRPGGDGNKLTVEELYRNWKLDTPPGKAVFSFSPPKDATKVDSLEGGSATRQKPRKNVAVFLFDRVEVIDFAGPYEVFLNASAANHSYFNVFTVAATDKAIETAGSLTIKPKYRFDNHPKIDILVLPGGGVLEARRNPEVIKWIQKTAKDAEIVMSVCNGAGFLAKAGLLDGKEVTTVAGGIPGLQAEVPTAKVVAGKRFVDSGKVVTCGGLSAGIDGALYVAQKALGKGWGQMIAVWMEYDWRPDGKCAWGLLADEWLPNPIVDWQDFKGVWTPTSYGGDTDHWENKARFETEQSAEELKAEITGNLTRSYKWSPRDNKTAERSGKGLWAFRDKRGRNWHGTVSVEAARDKRGVFDVTIRIDLQPEK
jgi:clostripain